MAAKQTRRSISVRGTTYDNLRRYCEEQDISMSEVVEEQIAKLLSRPSAGRPAGAGAVRQGRRAADRARAQGRLSYDSLLVSAETNRDKPTRRPIAVD